jgi:hypothetical protein
MLCREAHAAFTRALKAIRDMNRPFRSYRMTARDYTLAEKLFQARVFVES